MSSSETSLDVSRLEKIRRHPCGKITSRCPACAEEDHDRRGEHLAIFPNGKFACAAHPGDGGHRRRIFQLVGCKRWSSPGDASKGHSEPSKRYRQEVIRREMLAHTAKARRAAIIEQFRWLHAEVLESSPQKWGEESRSGCPRHFMSCLFSPEHLLWTGCVHDSGKSLHASRWKPCSEWMETSDPIGPMTTPAVWKPATFSRSAANVAAAPYTVLDFDGLDGIKPGTQAEISRHIRDSLALIRWLKEGMNWKLAAILWTGGKSLHAWFHSPPFDVLQSLKNTAAPLGIDAGLIGRPEHPCRLPGQRHSDTGKFSKVLWLQIPPVS
jgi:hypothetical protein